MGRTVHNAKKQTVVIYSGGLDSTTLLYHLRAEGHEVKALSVNYRQRHLDRELAAATAICTRLGVEHRTVDLTALVGFLGQNSLSDPSIAVPESEYTTPTMQLTTVPNRNMVMLSVGLAWAVSLDYDAVAFGAHGGEYTPYPDCQPAFAEAMDEAAQVCDWKPRRVLAPFVNLDKAGVVRRGAELEVPFELTWSCYKGGAQHCGKCGTCLDRREAFRKAGVPDPTRYQDQIARPLQAAYRS
jgi:7-cyano-7-deazaguanine synthase